MVTTLWLSGVIGDQIFTLGGMDVRTSLFVEILWFCLHVNFLRLVSTMKFSQFLVVAERIYPETFLKNVQNPKV